MKYSAVFQKYANRSLQIITKSPVGSTEPIMDGGFYLLSLLYFDDQKAFLALKTETLIGIKSGDFIGFKVFIVLAYINYVEGNFRQAVVSFKQALKYEPNDQGTWLFLAFCYRQLGQEQIFERILMKVFW